MAFVIPALAAVGTALGASSATAAAVGATAISTAVSVVGAGVGAYSAHASAKAQAATANEQARIANDNARRARIRSQVEQQDQDLVAKAILGELTSAQAGSGLSLTSGSFSSRRKSAAVLARKDALNIRQGGEIEAHNFLQQGADARFEARQARAAGTNSMLMSFLEAGGSIIDGAAQINKLKVADLNRRSRGLLVNG